MYTLSSRSDGIDTLNFATLYSVVGVDNCNLDSVAESRGLPLARLHLLLKIGEPVFCMTEPQNWWGRIGGVFTAPSDTYRYISVSIPSAKNVGNKRKTPELQQSSEASCGGWGIRTPEGLHPTRFPSVRHRPLGESSGA